MRDGLDIETTLRRKDERITTLETQLAEAKAAASSNHAEWLKLHGAGKCEFFPLTFTEDDGETERTLTIEPIWDEHAGVQKGWSIAAADGKWLDLRAQLAERDAELFELRLAIAYAHGKLDDPPLPQPAHMAESLRQLANERAAWVEVAIEHNKQCPQLHPDPEKLAERDAENQQLRDKVNRLSGLELTPSVLQARLDERDAEVERLKESLGDPFRSGVHHGHTQAIEAVRDHCNMYPGWRIHEKLEPLLAAARDRDPTPAPPPAEGCEHDWLELPFIWTCVVCGACTPTQPPPESGYDAVEVSLEDPFAETDEAAPPPAEETQLEPPSGSRYTCHNCHQSANMMGIGHLDLNSMAWLCEKFVSAPPPKPEGCGEPGCVAGFIDVTPWPPEGRSLALCPSCSGAGS